MNGEGKTFSWPWNRPLTCDFRHLSLNWYNIDLPAKIPLILDKEEHVHRIFNGDVRFFFCSLHFILNNNSMWPLMNLGLECAVWISFI